LNHAPALRAPWIAPAALVVALLSLALNGALLWRLRSPERIAAPAVARVLDRLGKSEGKIRYTVKIPAGTPLHFDIPIDQTYNVKLNTTLPINTSVRVPLRSPLGNHTVNLPVRANVPIRTDMPFRLRDTFRVRTQTQTEYVIPLEIRLRDLPLDELRGSLEP
jgi:hypothetical protein